MASGRARLPPTPTSTQTNNVRNGSYTNTVVHDDCPLNALGPEIAVTTTQVLDSLSERERQIILNVLSRDEGVRQRDAARIM